MKIQKDRSTFFLGNNLISNNVKEKLTTLQT